MRKEDRERKKISRYKCLTSKNRPNQVAKQDQVNILPPGMLVREGKHDDILSNHLPVCTVVMIADFLSLPCPPPPTYLSTPIPLNTSKFAQLISFVFPSIQC